MIGVVTCFSITLCFLLKALYAQMKATICIRSDSSMLYS